jgi:alanine dehydrogenase
MIRKTLAGVTGYQFAPASIRTEGRFRVRRRPTAVTLLLSQTDVEAILAQRGSALHGELIDGVRRAYGEVARGTADLHPRVYLRSRSDPQRRPPGMFSMSALLADEGRMGTRLRALGGPTTDGDAVLVMFDQRTLTCLAIINDRAIHSLRTGSPAGVATALLARAGAKTIGVIGSSQVAEGALTMTYHARPNVTSVRVFSPTQANRERFAAKMSARLGVPVTPVDSALEALRGADIAVTATDADRPVVPDEAIVPGMHFNCMSRNELTTEGYARGRIFLSSTELHKIHDPAFSPPLPHDAIAGDLSELVAGTIPGRVRDDEITIYAASGPLATWDVVSGSVLYDSAVALGIGQEISLW